MKKFILLVAVAAIITSCGPKTKYDVCIYGGTASGIVAANAAAKMGLDVVVIEPTCRIGGMTTGGLGRTDIGNKQVVKGLALKFYRDLGKHYGNLENWLFEPSAALEIMNEFADSPRIKVIKGYHMCDALKEGTLIKNIRVAGGKDYADTLTFKAPYFIDCSYEGDLMAAAGVSYRTGREDSSEYNEPYNGTQFRHEHQFPDGISPFVVPGDTTSGLLWGISTQTLNPDGTGDNLIQAYNFRLCLTDSVENMIPIEKPENYDPSRYELLIREYDAQPELRDVNKYFIWTLMPNRKTDVNNRSGFSTDMIGMNYNYPEGSWEEREAIYKAHKDYTLGLLYFTAHDERVPIEVRGFVRNWGLCKDEYTECGNWTPQLYVRECRRLVGEYVTTQADCEHRAAAEDWVAYAAYNMDSHNCQRIVIKKNGKYMVKNEGDIQIRGLLPYPLSYRSITPKREECTNLLVPVCCSASHIAYGSIRMEPVFMCLGQAAGIAVGMAYNKGLDMIQSVDYRDIQYVIANDPYMDGTLPDMLVDDVDAEVSGDWAIVRKKGNYGPSSAEGTSANGSAKFSFTVKNGGKYDLYTFQSKDTLYNNITCFDLSTGENLVVDSKEFEVVGQAAGAWRKIAEVDLKKDENFSVTIHGDGSEGIVRADALLMIHK